MNTHFFSWAGLRSVAARWDRALVAALLMAAVFSLHGIRWGRVECWNRDAMALRELKEYGRPQNYQKPPFLTFVTRFAVKAPVEAAEQIGRAVTGQRQTYNAAKLLGARLLVMAFFLGTIALAFSISRTLFGVFAARVTAFAMAASAGFIGFTHFLTCDAPLLFWMLLAFYFALRVNRQGALRDYLLAGFITGVATNTKYNGLAMGIALVAGHVLADRNRTWRERLFAPELIKGVLMVPVGLVVTNPYMVFDWNRFYNDFKYVNVVTPRYDGQADGVGYGKFFTAFPEVLGIPGTIALALLAAGSVVQLLVKRDKTEAAGFLMLLSVAALYVAKIGSFPRIETRFVLPVVPFALLMAGPALKALEKWRAAVLTVALPILAYNIACSFYIGTRFNADPRLGAQTWLLENVKPGGRIESSGASPRWKKLPELDAADVFVGRKQQAKIPAQGTVDFRMPYVTGRAERFKKMFSDDPWMQEQANRAGVYDESVFSLERLLERNPDVISVYSADCSSPSDGVRQYYADLLAGKYPYKVVYDRESPPVPAWVYPRHIDFLKGRIVLLERKP